MYISASKQVVKSARSWLGTPFHFQARTKNIGCDCLGLIIGIADEIKAISILSYKLLTLHDYNLYDHNIDGDKLFKEFPKHFFSWPIINNNLLPGRILLFSFPLFRYHLAIISNIDQHQVRIIHACINVGKVSEHLMPTLWQKYLCGIFSFCKSYEKVIPLKNEELLEK